MTKKWIAINLIMLVGVTLLGWQLYVSARNFTASNDTAKIEPAAKTRAEADAGLPTLQPPKRYMEAEYGIISGQNLFSESRGKEDPPEAAPVVEAPALNPPPTLVGVMIMGNQRVALINEPAGRGSSAQGSQSMKLGDTYKGYVVTDITERNIVLELGTRKEILPLFDVSKHTPQNSKTPIVATRVVNFGPAAAGVPGAAVTISTAAAGRGQGTPGRNQATPFGGTRAGQPNANAGGGRGGSRGQAGRGQVQTENAGAEAVPRAWNQTIDSQGRVIINSPFGQFPVTTTPPAPVKK